jgi:FkbM family methyltransferase
MIPDIIHFVWIGIRPRWTDSVIQLWSDLNPNFKIMIHEKEPDGSDVPIICQSDIFRTEKVHQYGGWYFDLDMIPIQSIREMALLCNKTDECAFLIGSKDHSDSNNCAFADHLGGRTTGDFLRIIEETRRTTHFRFKFGPYLFAKYVRETSDKYYYLCDHWDFYGRDILPEHMNRAVSIFDQYKKTGNFDDMKSRFDSGVMAFHLWLDGASPWYSDENMYWPRKRIKPFIIQESKRRISVEGIDMIIRNEWDEYICREVIKDDSYGLSKISFEPSKILDIGAHIGSFSVLCRRKWPLSKVVSIEPNKSNFDLLVLNSDGKSLNGAISDMDKPVLITGFPYRNGSLNTGMSKLSGVGCESVQGISAESLSVFEPELLKIDAEGIEFLVVSAFKDSIKKVKCIVGEFHSDCDLRLIFNLLSRTHKVSFNRFSANLGTFFALLKDK